MKKIICFFILSILIFSCSKDTQETSQIQNAKTLGEYKEVWKDSFKYYQTNTKEIKKSGVFDFEFTTMLDGNSQNFIDKFSNLDMKSEFNSLSFKVDGDYDFLDISNPKFNGNLKIYLNKRNFGLGDIDISFHLENSSHLKYTFNNLDKDTLNFFISDKNQIDAFSLYYEDNKGKELSYEVPQEIIKGLFQEANTIDIEESLYKNSKEEEQKIITSFLDNEVIEILSGETKNEIDTLHFKLNGDNLVEFLNDVGQILGNGNEKKNFDSDKELFKNIGVSGTLEIKNKEIQDSFINSDIILSGINNKGEKTEDKLNLKTTLKLIDYKNLNIDFTTLISSESTPDNKIQIRIKGLIK